MHRAAGCGRHRHRAADGRAGDTQGRDRLIQRRAGGHDVVDDDHVAARDAVRVEGTGDVGGARGDVEPALIMREARAGDRYMLCTDGLSDPVSQETILDALQIEDTAESADRLIELALRGGGPDNVTVVVADVVDYDYGQTQPILAGAVSGVDDQSASSATTVGNLGGANNKHHGRFSDAVLAHFVADLLIAQVGFSAQTSVDKCSLNLAGVVIRL